MFQAVKNLVLRAQGVRVVGRDKAGRLFTEQDGGAALFGRPRRSMENGNHSAYSGADLHPLWYAWLQYRRDDPPSEEEVESYGAHQQAVSQRVIGIDAVHRQQVEEDAADTALTAVAGRLTSSRAPRSTPTTTEADMTPAAAAAALAAVGGTTGTLPVGRTTHTLSVGNPSVPKPQHSASAFPIYGMVSILVFRPLFSLVLLTDYV